MIVEDTHGIRTTYQHVQIKRLTKTLIVFEYTHGRLKGQEGRVSLDNGRRNGEYGGGIGLLWPTDPIAKEGLHTQGMARHNTQVKKILDRYTVFPTDWNQRELATAITEMHDYANRTRSEKAANA